MDWNITIDGAPTKPGARWLGAVKIVLERDSVIVDFAATEVFASPRGSYLVQLTGGRHVYVGAGPLVMFETAAPVLAFRDRPETGPYAWDSAGALYLPVDGAAADGDLTPHSDYLGRRVCVPGGGVGHPQLWDRDRRRVELAWRPDADAAFDELERAHGRLFLHRSRYFPAEPLTRSLHESLLRATGLRPLRRQALNVSTLAWEEPAPAPLAATAATSRWVEVFDADSSTDETEDAAI
jgi:hypothetical protein